MADEVKEIASDVEDKVKEVTSDIKEATHWVLQIIVLALCGGFLIVALGILLLMVAII